METLVLDLFAVDLDTRNEELVKMESKLNIFQSYERFQKWQVRCADTLCMIPACEYHLYDKQSGLSYSQNSDTYKYHNLGASEKQEIMKSRVKVQVI